MRRVKKRNFSKRIGRLVYLQRLLFVLWAESQLLWAESQLSFDAAAAAVLAYSYYNVQTFNANFTLNLM